MSGDTAHTLSPIDDALVPYPAGDVARYRSAGCWRGRSLPDELADVFVEHADRRALVTADVCWTYAELHREVQVFARGISASTTLRPGDRVMFQMGNVAETVVAYLGGLTAGLVPVCTLAQHGAREVGLLAKHVGARGLITQADFRDGRLLGVAQALSDEGIVDTVIVARGDAFAGAQSYTQIMNSGAADNAASSAPAPTLTDVAVFQLSGGTTGLPKVAPRLHEEYVYNSQRWAQVLGWSPTTTILYPLPLMHNAGIALALQPALFSGATTVLAESADTDLMLDLIAAERPTVLPLVPPAVAIRLLENPRSATTDLTCIEQFIVGGQKLAVEVARQLRDDLGIQVRQMFGMAEGMFLVTPPDADERVDFNTVGHPISPLDEVRIVNPATLDDVAPGELGELWARGPYTIRGYYRAPQHNISAFTADGFYRTGDLARAHLIDGETYYSIDGRIKDVINRGVEKIHAEEVEELILEHPGVENAAVVAMPDPVLGEKVCAYIVMHDAQPPLTVPTLAAHLGGLGLAKYKFPERVEIRTALPLSNVGKISRKDLRDDIAGLLTQPAGA
ncbi:AMP-binding protein [Gordonia sp. TBRC 11910]|uniref:AMP-binding protein n=1 Tax=Gordonia asplenii TaxID=2725283 RepID=A0A848KVR2_9ACTN|nr:AMP-binding protein [Gordonia asplenii]NMO02944.1 AMP-binding protein [Gordonia asplenii]